MGLPTFPPDPHASPSLYQLGSARKVEGEFRAPDVVTVHLTRAEATLLRRLVRAADLERLEQAEELPDVARSGQYRQEVRAAFYARAVRIDTALTDAQNRGESDPHPPDATIDTGGAF